MAGVGIFGLTQVPYAPDPGRLAGNIHAIGGKIGIALLGLHVLAARKHQFYNRDGLPRRMLPFRFTAQLSFAARRAKVAA